MLALRKYRHTVDLCVACMSMQALECLSSEYSLLWHTDHAVTPLQTLARLDDDFVSISDADACESALQHRDTSQPSEVGHTNASVAVEGVMLSTPCRDSKLANWHTAGSPLHLRFRCCLVVFIPVTCPV